MMDVQLPGANNEKSRRSGATKDKLKGPRSLKMTLREIKAYTKLMIYKEDKNAKVLIFGQGRSGTTLLEDLLSSTGHFKSFNEVLGRGAEHVIFPELYVRGLSVSRDPGIFLCHIKYYHLDRDRIAAGHQPVDPADFLRSLNRRGWHIIFLWRRNRVKQHISNLVRDARRKPHKTDDLPEAVKVSVQRDRLQQNVEARMETEVRERLALEGLPYYEVNYERDLENPGAHQATVDGIMDFLKLQRRPVTTKLRKVNSRPLKDIITNFDEFSAWVSELGWTDSLDG